MADKAQTLNTFWNGFGLSAYDENTVQVGTELPYITYTVSIDSLGYPVALSASLWYRSTSWTDITKKAAEIERYIGRRGVTLPYEDGILWIKRGNPFSQRMSDDDDSIRRIYINIEAEYLSAN